MENKTTYDILKNALITEADCGTIKDLDFMLSVFDRALLTNIITSDEYEKLYTEYLYYRYGI